MSNCAVCKKYVAMPEERKACGKVFHIECFKCGTLDESAGGCSKKLTLDSYTDRKGVPFCKTCYGKLYGPKGFIGGTTSFNNFDEKGGQVVNDRNARTIDNEVIPKPLEEHGLKSVPKHGLW